MLKNLVRLALALAIPAIGAVALSPTLATANVRTVQSGPNCHPLNGKVVYEGVPSPVQPEIEFSGYNGINWKAPAGSPMVGDMAVYCSLDRHLPLSTTGWSDIEIRVRAFANPTALRMGCGVYVMKSDGTLQDGFSGGVNIPAADTNPNTPEQHTFDIGSGLDSSYSKGHAVAWCDLPEGVGLVSVYASENDGISGN